MAEIGQRRKVAVSQLGKYKTTLQIIGLFDDALSPGSHRTADLPRGRYIYRPRGGSYALLDGGLLARRMA